MASASAAADLDRLPWLTDEAKPARRRKPDLLLPAAFAAATLIAAGSFWLGLQSGDEPVQPVERVEPAQPSATVALPEPKEEAVRPTPAPLIEPTPVAPDAPQPRPATAAPARRIASKPVEVPAAPIVAPAPARLQLWPSWQSAGAAGRMVRIGTFASSLQAKRAWRKIMRIYPGMQRLPAVVVSSRSARNGRIYYRLQMGTTSQAHSVVLCQRMRIVGVSCVVVGLQPR